MALSLYGEEEGFCVRMAFKKAGRAYIIEDLPDGLSLRNTVPKMRFKCGFAPPAQLPGLQNDLPAPVCLVHFFPTAHRLPVGLPRIGIPNDPQVR